MSKMSVAEPCIAPRRDSSRRGSDSWHRRAKRALVKPARRLALHLAATGWRAALGAAGTARFVGVTGSCGKTTATELLAAILAAVGRVRLGSNENTLDFVTRTLLRTAPRHRFCVQELSAEAPGLMQCSTRLFQPNVGVVLNVAQDHYGSFRSLDATAAEKGWLVERLPPSGLAVLNADDPRVRAMRQRTRARVLTFGMSDEADVRGESVHCAWPTPLSLDVCFRGTRLHLQTRLWGEHWVGAVLAAIAAAVGLGVPPAQAADAIAAFPPVPFRMSEHRTPDGVTFINDSWKMPLWAMPAVMDFMRKASARRKILVLTLPTDSSRSFAERQRDMLREGLRAADLLLFVGEHALTALRPRAAHDNPRVRAFPALRDLNAFLADGLQPGDLVLLKAVEQIDHLQRLILVRTGTPVTCWRDRCGKRRFCQDCRYLTAPPAGNQPDVTARAGCGSSCPIS